WASNRSVRPLRGRWLEASLLVAALVGSAAFVFAGVYQPTRHSPLAFLCIPPIVWAAFRFSSRETVTAIALLSVIATYGTQRNAGPFVVDGAANLVILQAFMAVVAVMALSIAALVAEGQRVNRERLRLLSAEQAARAEAEAANLAKDEFLAMLGHELRNPIAAISTAVHVLSRSLAFDGAA